MADAGPVSLRSRLHRALRRFALCGRGRYLLPVGAAERGLGLSAQRPVPAPARLGGVCRVFPLHGGLRHRLGDQGFVLGRAAQAGIRHRGNPGLRYAADARAGVEPDRVRPVCRPLVAAHPAGDGRRPQPARGALQQIPGLPLRARRQGVRSLAPNPDRIACLDAGDSQRDRGRCRGPGVPAVDRPVAGPRRRPAVRCGLAARRVRGLPEPQ